MSPEKIITSSPSSAHLDSISGPPPPASLPALDYSLGLLRQLRDVVLCARDNSKLFAHRAILARDPFFAALFSSSTKVSNGGDQQEEESMPEYHLDEHPDALRRRIERAYKAVGGGGGEKAQPQQQQQVEIIVLRAKKKSNHVNSGSRHCHYLHQVDTETDTSRTISAEQSRVLLHQQQQRPTSGTSSADDELDKNWLFAYEASGLLINEFPFNVAMELDKGLIRRLEGTFNGGHSYFTYLLLDPVFSDQFGSGNSLAVQIMTSFFKFSKLTRDNYYRIALEQVNMDLFKRFVAAIFFISTGEGGQMGRLVDVNELVVQKGGGGCPKKATRIRRIIASGRGGPVPLYVFTGLSRVEAEARQHLMMQAIGTGHLVNDDVAHEPPEPPEPPEPDSGLARQNQVVHGTYLLLKSFLHFVSNGQRHSPVSISPSPPQSPSSLTPSSSSSSPSSVNQKQQQQQELLNRIISFK